MRLILKSLKLHFFLYYQAPKLTPLLSPRTQIEGSSFNVFCALEYGSLPVFFEWTKSGHTIKTGPEVSYKIENSKKLSTLTIDEITKVDSDNYSCIVRNSVGTDTQSVLLNVKGIAILYYFKLFNIHFACLIFNHLD